MDKSREQFEAYFIQYHLNDNPGMVELFLKRDGEGYKLPCPNDEWRIWQASRAAVEIDAPAEPFYPMPINSCPTDHYHYGRESVISKVRAAGLKVKGE
ncbi:hypothetical protein PN545_001043 [Cronobacter sakazakii]|uniref:hypothetical protein n=1 Tax=Cronobacter malonaticus TaxID=413503 RepID=UPI000CFC9994|nr:hypothetical protein [Cronobacter malonaticus]EKK5197012.1 hypothetical protein [Cronobacter sakazakii]